MGQLKRGIKEELGLNDFMSVTNRLWSFSWEDKKGEPNIDLVYGVEINFGTEIKINPQEHSEYRWCSFDEAMEILGKDNNKKAFIHFQKQIINAK